MLGAALLRFVVHTSLFPAHSFDLGREPWDVMACTGGFGGDGFDGGFREVGEFFPIVLDAACGRCLYKLGGELPSLRSRASLPLIRPWILNSGVLSKMADATVNTSIGRDRGKVKRLKLLWYTYIDNL